MKLIYRNISIKLGFVSILIVFSFSSKAQSTRWQIFKAMFNGKPGIVEVDTQVKKMAPIPNQPYVFSVGLKLEKCDSMGLPLKVEYKNMEAISNSVIDLLEKKGNYSSVGTYASECIRIHYFYVADTTGLINEITNLNQYKFPDRKLGFNIEKDARWDTYFNFLYPGNNYKELKNPVSSR